jgi:hypothetical protein
MSNSLRDQLLGLGFSAPKPDPRPQRDARKPAGKGGKPAHARKPGPQHRKPQSREDIDLARPMRSARRRKKTSASRPNA